MSDDRMPFDPEEYGSSPEEDHDCYICDEPIMEIEGEWFHMDGDQDDHEAQPIDEESGA